MADPSLDDMHRLIANVASSGVSLDGFGFSAHPAAMQSLMRQLPAEAFYSSHGEPSTVLGFPVVLDATYPADKIAFCKL